MLIAIDGLAASGKGVLGRRLAARYRLRYLDTGLLYRAFAWLALEAGLSLADLQNEEAVLAAVRPRWRLSILEESALRSEVIGQAASCVAALPAVRSFLYHAQRSFLEAGDCILDGRDIGQVIAPEADVKFFVTASLEVRAQRRWDEMRSQAFCPPSLTYESVLKDLAERDLRDRTRSCAPLIPAEDAHLLDTTHDSIEAVMQKAIHVIESSSKKR